MVRLINESSIQKVAKIAGFLFLFIVIGSILYGTLILFKLTDSKNILITARNITENELVYRVGIIWGLLLSFSIITLAICLYSLLNSTHKVLALLAASLKIVEGTLVAVIALLSLISINLLQEQQLVQLIKPEQVHAIVGFLYNNQAHLHSIVMAFLGLNFSLFFYLLYKSSYVPKTLSGFGIVSYVLIFIFAFVSILFPRFETTITQSIFWGPSVLFEFLLGFRLMRKGIDIHQ